MQGEFLDRGIFAMNLTVPSLRFLCFGTGIESMPASSAVNGTFALKVSRSKRHQ
jgi:hypothetical protein